MQKPYNNNAVIGNSKMLGCIDNKGEIIRLFWPNIDYPQHLDSMNTGILIKGESAKTIWFNDDLWEKKQEYKEDTNVLETLFSSEDMKLDVLQSDFCALSTDILFRVYKIKNLDNKPISIKFFSYSSFQTSIHNPAGVLFDFERESLIHYKNNCYMSVSSPVAVEQFQLGNNAFECAKNDVLYSIDSIGMMPDAALTWDIGLIEPGKEKLFCINICFSHTLKDLKRMAQNANTLDFLEEYKKTCEYWNEYIIRHTKVNIQDATISNLYKRSILVFKLMYNEKTGGILASPEIDEEFSKCGRYAYCWGRDAAFITGAFDKCGLKDEVEKFYDWAMSIQEEEGYWQQRYYMDGNLAPSWGLQFDETGSIVWGMYEHYKNTKNKDFLEKAWKSVEKAVEFMINNIDEETGVHKPCFDLWEERFGEHAYTSAAVYAGINAGVKIANILGIKKDKISKWENAAISIKESIENNFWKKEENVFLRSIRLKLNPWGDEPSDNTTLIKINPKGSQRSVTLEDNTVDSSLLGLSIPFEVIKADDDKMIKMVEKIEMVLSNHQSGGLKRYENDNYIGGNPWVITTLWAALYHAKNNNYLKAKKYFDWAVKARTKLNLLPEQVDRETGNPAWVIPLTWSHAMFILVLFELSEADML